MSYKVDKLKNHSKRQWRVFRFTYIKGEKKPKIEHVPYAEYRGLGFNPESSIEEARRHAKLLNQESGDQQKRHRAIAERIAKEEAQLKLYFPAEDIEQFESEVLYERHSHESAQRNKIASRWRAAMKCIQTVKLEVSTWSRKKTRFYDYFRDEKWSMSWVEKVLPIINLYGNFYSEKHRIYFQPIPHPVGIERERIKDTYAETHIRSLASKPLSPAMLESKKSRLQESHYRWLYLSIWLGLSPDFSPSMKLVS